MILIFKSCLVFGGLILCDIVFDSFSSFFAFLFFVFVLNIEEVEEERKFCKTRLGSGEGLLLLEWKWSYMAISSKHEFLISPSFLLCVH